MKRAKERLHRVIVIGATPAGIVAANKLGELGIPVTLVDSEPDMDTRLSDEACRLKSGILFSHVHRPGLIRILRNPGIRMLLPASVRTIKHNPQGFSVGLTKYPTFIDPDRCTQCGRCVENCPVSSGDGKKAVKFSNRLSLPGRPYIDKRRAPLCRENCPLGVNAQGYVALTRQGKYDEALSLIREKNVLPGICGRICNHPCESACRRGELDDAVSIRAIKRFLADYEAERGQTASVPEPEMARKEKFAIIGSGPAGLAAAAELARHGCQVTVYEKEEKAGGLLRYGIGPHRLPRNILDAELAWIEKLGVKFVTGHAVALDQLESFKKDFDGVILTVGSWKDRPLGAEGENLAGVEGCLAFLNRFYRGEVTEVREKVAVIGDGNGAFDLARTLSRIGADVTLLSWFSKAEIPADPDEIQGAEDENIHIKDRLQVVAFLGENGKVNRVRCMATEPGPKDAKGIAWPVIPKDAKPVELSFDRVFVAVGQKGAFAPGKPVGPLAINDYGFIAADGSETGIPGVWVAGDAVTGPATVVRAMAGGRSAALKILQDVCGVEGLEMPPRPDADFPAIATDIPTQSRIPMPEIQPTCRKEGFAEVALGLSESQVIYEAGRCLQCGVCSECMECLSQCAAIQAVRHDDAIEEMVEQAGAVIIADPDMAPQVRGEDVIRAYGPKSSKPDVYAMMTRGFAAAAQAMVLLNRTSNVQKGHGMSFHQPAPELAPAVRIGVFVCRCNDSQGWMEEMDRYMDGLTDIKNVVHAQTLTSACVPEGTASILRTVREKGITRIVLGSCVCCPLDFVCSACTDQRSRLKHSLFTATGITRSMVMTRNIRGEALSLMKKDPEHALRKFTGIMDRSVRGAQNLKQFPVPARVYNFNTAVIGESEPTFTSALTLAEAGMEVFMFGAAGVPLSVKPDHPNIHCFSDAWVNKFSGTLGDFQLEVETADGFRQQVHTGAVIIGEQSRKRVRYIHQEGLPCRAVEADMQEAGATGVPFFYPGMTSVSGLFIADPPGVGVSNRKKGAAVAVLAAAVMPRGPRRSKGYTVSVNPDVCRGCGRCVDVCLYQAVILKKNDVGGWHASVDEAFCKGCGNCISVCPSNAADSPYRSQKFFEQTLEEILLQ